MELLYDLPNDTLSTIKLPREGCLKLAIFSDYLLYTITLLTTVGYGINYACSHYAQVFCVFYSMLGIPLMLTVLGKMGTHFFQLIEWNYVRVYKKFHPEVKLIDVPFWIGPLFTVVWM